MTDDRYDVAVETVARHLIALAIDRSVSSRIRSDAVEQDIVDRMRHYSDSFDVEDAQLAAAWEYLDNYSDR